jgi:hypothetical protein
MLVTSLYFGYQSLVFNSVFTSSYLQQAEVIAMPVLVCTFTNKGLQFKKFNCQNYVSIYENCTSGEVFDGILANETRNQLKPSRLGKPGTTFEKLIDGENSRFLLFAVALLLWSKGTENAYTAATTFSTKRWSWDLQRSTRRMIF